MSDLTFILSRLNFSDVIDIFLVALIFYWVLKFIQGTQAVQLLRGILVLSVLAATIAGIFNTFTALSWLIAKALPALLIAIPVIFQPELRRALERVGRTGGLLASTRQPSQIEEIIKAVADAVVVLSQKKHGALLVFERETGLEDHIETGVRLDANVSSTLLLTIFYPSTTLHDGGVIIRDDKIVAAAAVLPLNGYALTDSRLLGTRHRAAIGISEVTDAIAVVVSEETGLISVAHNGQLIRGLDRKRLEQLLTAFFKSKLADHIPGKLGFGQTVLRRLGMLKSSKPVIQTHSQSKR